MSETQKQMTVMQNLVYNFIINHHLQKVMVSLVKSHCGCMIDGDNAMATININTVHALMAGYRTFSAQY